MDGQSVLSEWTGPDRPWTVPVVTEGLIKDVHRRRWSDLPPGLTTSGLRVGRYKLINYANGESELYDLAVDPNELASVYDDPHYAAIRSEMVSLWERYKDCKRAACRAPMPANLQQDPATLAQQDHHAHAARKAYYDR